MTKPTIPPADSFLPEPHAEPNIPVIAHAEMPPIPVDPGYDTLRSRLFGLLDPDVRLARKAAGIENTIKTLDESLYAGGEIGSDGLSQHQSVAADRVQAKIIRIGQENHKILASHGISPLLEDRRIYKTHPPLSPDNIKNKKARKRFDKNLERIAALREQVNGIRSVPRGNEILDEIDRLTAERVDLARQLPAPPALPSPPEATPMPGREKPDLIVSPQAAENYRGLFDYASDLTNTLVSQDTSADPLWKKTARAREQAWGEVASTLAGDAQEEALAAFKTLKMLDADKRMSDRAAAKLPAPAIALDDITSDQPVEETPVAKQSSNALLSVGGIEATSEEVSQAAHIQGVVNEVVETTLKVDPRMNRQELFGDALGVYLQGFPEDTRRVLSDVAVALDMQANNAYRSNAAEAPVEPQLSEVEIEARNIYSKVKEFVDLKVSENEDSIPTSRKLSKARREVLGELYQKLNPEVADEVMDILERLIKEEDDAAEQANRQTAADAYAKLQLIAPNA